MYGKHFESMYEGSMYGSGVAVFAVWGYVIANAHFGVVELNPKKLADTLGGTRDEIEGAIDFLMKPDPESRNKEHGGKRLIKEGEYQYRIPSWERYQAMRNDWDRREYNREAKRRERERKKLNQSGTKLAGESAYQKADLAGDHEAMDRIAAEGR